MSDSNILSAAIDAFKQTFTKMCSDLPNMLDTLDEKSFKMMTEVLLNAAGNAGIAGLETFLAESDTVHATITKNVYTARMPEEKSIEFKKEFERMVKTVESKFSGDTGPVYRLLLTDGHLMIKGSANESAFLRQYEKCLDLYHATEHL